MIVFDLECRAAGHRFEGWFGSGEDFTRQQERGLVACPQCGSVEVLKAPMAPNVARKGNQLAVPAQVAPRPGPVAPAAAAAPPPLPPQALAVLQHMAMMQAEALKRSRWVGERFAEDARAMHYGETDEAPIHGQATIDEARELLEEGIEIAPVLFPLAVPGQVN